MTTKRLYYTDSYTTHFQAAVLEHTTYEGAPAVVLDQTCFYPTSGGQPHDTGILNNVPVIDVVVRETDGAVLHVLGSDLAAEGTLQGQIDWARRFDHMRHHTGQHILSQAFIQVAEAETVGFHMSADSITIDLDKPALKPDIINAAEDLANQITAENRPVRAWFPSEAEQAGLALRKVPEINGGLRVVAVEDFDITACGGTHVDHTGSVGMIKVIRADRRGDTLRVEFRCGQRALLDYREKNTLMNRLAAALTVGYWEVPDALERLRAENKKLLRDVRTLRESVLESEADRLWQAAAPTEGGWTLVVQAFEKRDVGEVRQLTLHLIAHPATVALCGLAADQAQLITARSEDLPFDMVAVLKQGLAVWHIDRGGGRPSFAQGGGAPATLAQVEAALAAAAHAIRSVPNEG